MENLQTDLSRGLTAADAARVMSLGTTLELAPGSILFRLGEQADRIYLVTRGRITLTLPMNVGGKEQDVLVEERLAGEILGWSGLIPPHRFTLKAAAPTGAQVMVFERQAVLELFQANPAIGFAVTRNVATAIGHRLGVFQAMWLREMQRVVDQRWA